LTFAAHLGQAKPGADLADQLIALLESEQPAVYSAAAAIPSLHITADIRSPVADPGFSKGVGRSRAVGGDGNGVWV